MPPSPSASAIDGLLAIDKPAGMTSHDVVAIIRRLSRQRRVGHGGTLDPLATGILVLGLGRGTRLLEYVAGGSKEYLAIGRLGSATDTYDADGATVREAAWRHINEALFRTVLAEQFTGPILQRPPAYSAIKQHGVAVHRLARRGVAVELPPRPVTIEALELRRFEPPQFELLVRCSTGTYVRSLVHDAGEAAGSAAHLTALRRTCLGSFSLRDCVTLAGLQAEGDSALQAALIALDRPMELWPAVVLGSGSADDVVHGRTLYTSASGSRCRAYDTEGRFLAVLHSAENNGEWHPAKVLLPA